MKYIMLALLSTAFFMTACSKDETQAADTAKQASDATQSAEKKSTFGVSKYVEGQHYQRIENPVPKADPSKPEVAEVFWYGCIHCFNFEPLLEKWVKESKPSDVQFVQVPAIWNEQLSLHAKIFYTIQKMGLYEKMNMKVFEAMNKDKKQFKTADEIADFFEANGQDRKNFLNVFNSEEINNQVVKSAVKVKAYGIEGTPELIVNGRYRTSASMAGSQSNMFDVVAYLLSLKD